MTDTSSHDPSQRQILANIGNRWLVFGSEATLPRQVRFTPADGDPTLKRVAEPAENAEYRILHNLRVTDAEVTQRDGPDKGFDLILSYPDKSKVFVEIKVREREPTKSDFDSIIANLNRHNNHDGETYEIWLFNIERPKVHIFKKESARGLQHYELRPLNVWEYNEDRTPFERARVVREVEDWVRRIEDLYQSIEGWAKKRGMRSDRSRTVEMSEELMQQFSVPDRELSVLDLLKNDEPIVSFVPRGLWIVGAHGRVDAISKDGTRALLLLRRGESFEWSLAAPDRRNLTPFNEEVFVSLIGDA